MPDPMRCALGFAVMQKHSAIAELPENQRVAFTLNKVEGLSYQEVSEIMKSTVSSVESLMHRAKNNLKKKLEDHYNSRK